MEDCFRRLSFTKSGYLDSLGLNFILTFETLLTILLSKYLNISIMSKLEKIFQALGNRTRLEIISLILSAGEVSCQDLSSRFNLAQPTLSHHFKELIGSGILKVRKIGVENYYSIDKSLLSEAGFNNKKLLEVATKEFQTARKGV